MPLSADPSIEALQLRQRVEVLAGWRNLLLSLFLLAGAIVWLVLSPGTRVEAGIATSLATGLAGVQLDRLLEARRGRDDFYRDVITLTSIFYQSPATIRGFLGQESIERSIANLLKAALGSDALGATYWQQSVRPFIAFRDRFREDWRYSIDLRDLQEPIEIGAADRRARLQPSEYRRLSTSLLYNQTVLEPSDVYWVACAFDPHTIPTWFREPHYLLGEVVPLPPALRQILIEALSDPVYRATGNGRRRRAQHPETGEHDSAFDIARKVFDAKVRVNGESLPAREVFADAAGIRWGFALTQAQRKAPPRSLEIQVEVETLQPRAFSYFPVAISAPTRHPTVRFNYGMCESVGEVRSEVFFSAERPYDDSLRVISRENRRIEVATRPTDWVMAGSGCVFVWDDPTAAGSQQRDRSFPQALDRPVAPPGAVGSVRQ